MGMVSFLAEERHSLSESKLKAHLATALGGSCAETIVLGERSTGAQADYKQATSLARSMVCDWGMSEDLGPMSLGSEEDEVFLGKEFTRTRNYSEQTAHTIDQEIQRLVVEAASRATNLIEANLQTLNAIADALLEYEVLDDDEIELVVSGKQVLRGPKPDEKAKSSDSEVDHAAANLSPNIQSKVPEGPVKDGLAAEGNDA